MITEINCTNWRHHITLTSPTLPTGDETAILRGHPTSVHVFAFHVNEIKSRINKGHGLVPSDL